MVTFELIPQLYNYNPASGHFRILFIHTGIRLFSIGMHAVGQLTSNFTPFTVVVIIFSELVMLELICEG